MEVSAWDKALTIATIATAFLFACVLVAQVIATFYTSRSANAAKKTADAAIATADEAKRSNDSIVDEFRPWVGIGSPEPQEILSKDMESLARRPHNERLMFDPDRIPDDAVCVFLVPVTNHGRRPAVNVAFRMAKGCTEAKASNALVRQLNTAQANGVLWPGQTHQEATILKKKDLIRIVKNEPVYLAAGVVYSVPGIGRRVAKALFKPEGIATSVIWESADVPFTDE